MTGDDLVKLIMAGTGAVATIYTISHPETQSTLYRTTGTDLGYQGANNTTGLLLLGVLAIVLLK